MSTNLVTIRCYIQRESSVSEKTKTKKSLIFTLTSAAGSSLPSSPSNGCSGGKSGSLNSGSKA